MSYFYKRKLRKIITEECISGIDLSLDLIEGMDWYVLPSLGSKELTKDDIELDKLPKLYWQRIVDHSNLVAFTTLTRNYEWVRGVVSAFEEKNFFSYCSNLRSLLESCADAYFTLKDLPKMLATEYRTIYESIHDEIEFVYLDPDLELEKHLRHFLHASKNHSSKDEDTVFPKPAREYLNSLQSYLNTDDFSQLLDLWAVLCEIVHPASFSVNTFVHQRDELAVLVNKSNWSQVHLLTFRNGARDILSKILIEVMIKSFLVLKLTDLFVKEPNTYYTRYISYLNDTKEWNECLDEIAKSEEKYLGRLNRMED